MTDLLVERIGHTTVLTLNRPERLNALSDGLLSDLSNAIKAFEADPDQYVAIITGAGEKAFCAGGDLKEMASKAAGGQRLPMSPTPDIAGVAACDKVTIAAVNGLAVSGGFELALCCDIRIAADTAWFGVSEVKRGILAGVAVSVLPRLMPIGVAMDMMLSGDPLTAAQAYQFGLVQKTAPAANLKEVALEKAATIGRNSQAAVRGTKQIIKYWRNLMSADHQRYYEAVNHRVLLSGDVFEGPRAFAEKRDPVFSSGWPNPFDNK